MRIFPTEIQTHITHATCTYGNHICSNQNTRKLEKNAKNKLMPLRTHTKWEARQKTRAPTKQPTIQNTRTAPSQLKRPLGLEVVVVPVARGLEIKTWFQPRTSFHRSIASKGNPPPYHLYPHRTRERSSTRNKCLSSSKRQTNMSSIWYHLRILITVLYVGALTLSSKATELEGSRKHESSRRILTNEALERTSDEPEVVESKL